MSWSDRTARLFLVAALAAGTAGCLRPVYGPTASGVPVQDSLASVDVLTVGTSQGQERLGHELRSELVYLLNGSGTTALKKARLRIDAAESVQVTTTDTTTGRADAAALNVTAKFVLTSLDEKTILYSGTARTTATYFRDPQRFASVRAARDAEIRASKLLADDIKQRLAAYFATST